MKKRKVKKFNQFKPALGYSPVQKTASGAGTHEKPPKARRRDERRKGKLRLKDEEHE